MVSQESKKLASENAALKQSLRQKDKKIASITVKVNELTRAKKSLANKLERSKEKCKGLKKALCEEQKKTF
jgi:ABC-type enterochelin transport system substrate-binding protein